MPKETKEERMKRHVLEYRYFINENGELIFQHPAYVKHGIKTTAKGILSESTRHEHGVYLR